MTIGIIIQARMGSTRLPGKVLKPIAGKALLDHVLGRVALLQHPCEVIVATSCLPMDNYIEHHCISNEVSVFRGSEADVLDRYYQCAREKSFNHVVRLTADNPFTDAEELQRLIELHLIEHNDYSHSFNAMPLGVGAEIFSFEALEISAKEGNKPNHREHVNEYIQEHHENFKIGTLTVAPMKHCPNLRLTVDTIEDYERACMIAARAPSRWIWTEEAISICSHSA